MRDVMGITQSPAIAWLGAPSDAPVRLRVPVLPVGSGWSVGLRCGDRITFVDARGKKRSMTTGKRIGSGRLVAVHETSYLAAGTKLSHVDRRGVKHTVRVGLLPSVEVKIGLTRGDRLVIHKDPRPGEPALQSQRGKVTRPAHVSCTLPGVFRCVKRGEPVFFDDGVIEGVIEKVMPRAFIVRITRAAGGYATLRADKGINLPQTMIPAHGLTAKDKNDLRCAARHADLVSLSFVRSARDVLALRRELGRIPGPKPAVVIKIETRQAVEQLPAIIRATTRFARSGLMMARGDLAVEAGWEHLAALEFTLMDACRAVQLPFFIATQFLESMTRRGIPSRSEIIDVAAASAAQCILLNKGAHIVDAVRMAGKVLQASAQRRET